MNAVAIVDRMGSGNLPIKSIVGQIPIMGEARLGHVEVANMIRPKVS